MNPKARTDGLTTRRFGDELVVFDATTGAVHHLNRVAETVFRSCDGRTDFPALARIVGRALGVPDAGAAVELALEQLSRRKLLATPVERAAPERRRDRRQALQRLAAALALPSVLTVTATTARALSPCSVTCPNGVVVHGLVQGGFCSAICSPVTVAPSCVGVTNGTVCIAGGSAGFCCNEVCVPFAAFQTDPNNCGSCGNVCETFETCENGVCRGEG